MELTRHIDIKAVPKPRQTQSDRWRQRPCVLKYRAFADELRLKFGKVPDASSISVAFFIKTPDSWSKKKRELMANKFHQQKPDADNLLKAVVDALFSEDKGIAQIQCVKRWSDKDYILINLGMEEV